MWKKIILLSILSLSLTGCATIFSDSVSPVIFSSIPTGANIIIRNEDGQLMFKGDTPTTLTLDASAGYFDGQTYTVYATLPGYRPSKVQIESGISGWYWGNILIGGVIGMVIVDPATGDMFTLPKRCIVTLQPISDTNGQNKQSSLDRRAKKTRKLRIVTVSEVPAQLRDDLVPLK